MSSSFSFIATAAWVLFIYSLYAQEHFEALRIESPFYEVLAYGDLDGDGDIDMLARNSGTFFVRANDSNARFAPGLPLGAGTLSIATRYLIFDANLDGLGDIIAVRNTGTTTEFVTYRNLGGFFVVTTTLTLPGNFHSSAKFRGDSNNHDDLLVGLSIGPEAAFGWLRGSPSGFLIPFIPVLHPPPVIQNGGQVLNFDLDGDGDDDLVTRTLPSDGTVRILRNDAGEFVEIATIPVPVEFDAGRLALGDVNGDGFPDFVLAQNSNGANPLRRTATAFGDGTASFVFDPVNSYPHLIATAQLLDMNADGFADLVECFPNFSVNSGRGDGTFGLPQIVPMTQLGHFGTIGHDLDNDGYPDVQNGGDIILTTGEYDGLNRTWRIFGDTDVDWDGDGDIDVVDVKGPPPWSWAANDGRGHLTAMGTIPLFGSFGAGLLISESFPLDFDQDGDLDLLVRLNTTQPHPTTGAPQIVFAEYRFATNDRGIRFIPGSLATPLPGQELPVAARAIGDIDGDGTIDIVGSSTVWHGNGAGLFTPSTVGFGWNVATLADINGDGRLDIVAHRTIQGSREVLVFLNFPSGFAEVTALFYPSPTTLFPGIVRVADIDQDGDLDLLVTLHAQSLLFFSSIVVVENQGASLPTNHTLHSFNSNINSLDVADTDLDGRLELIVSHSTFDSITSCTVLELSPSGALETIVNYDISESPITLLDVDGDGDLDIVSHTFHENRLFRRYNGSGERRQYGAPTPTSAGHSPRLGVRGALRPGECIEILGSRIRGGTSGLLAIGLTPFNGINLPLPGLTTNIDLIVADVPILVDGPLGLAAAGTFTLPAIVPAELGGAALYLQAAFLDPLGPAGVTMSQGLALKIGD